MKIKRKNLNNITRTNDFKKQTLEKNVIMWLKEDLNKCMRCENQITKQPKYSNIKCTKQSKFRTSNFNFNWFVNLKKCFQKYWNDITYFTMSRKLNLKTFPYIIITFPLNQDIYIISD